ncbi:MAG TPA: hypothetical protein VD813_07755 [Pseudonocardia sp.]|nr:hypothetical protein [Pseudonocardia sp.]
MSEDDRSRREARPRLNPADPADALRPEALEDRDEQGTEQQGSPPDEPHTMEEEPGGTGGRRAR